MSHLIRTLVINLLVDMTLGDRAATALEVGDEFGLVRKQPAPYDSAIPSLRPMAWAVAVPQLHFEQAIDKRRIIVFIMYVRRWSTWQRS